MKLPITTRFSHGILLTTWIGLAPLGGNALAQTCPAPSIGSLFNLSICIEGRVETISSNSLDVIINQINEVSVGELFPEYVKGVSAGEYRLDVRGLPVILSFAQGSSALFFTVPSLGITETFNGGTRDASTDLYENYLKQEGEEILRELLRVSPVDPLAGNPASLQSQMVATAYGAGVDPVYDTLEPGSSFGIGARFGRYNLDQFAQNVFTLPVEYSYTFSNYDKLIVSAPLTYMEVEGAASYRGNLALSYKKNIFGNWALTPSLGYGIVGSDSLTSLGQIFASALTSDLMLFHNEKYQLSMGNMVGYYWSLPTDMGDYSVDYDLENTIVRNGLLLSMPLPKQIWGRAFSLDMYVTDTRFFGDAIYSDNFQEIGISAGPRRSADKLKPNLASHPIGVGVKYIRGARDIQGFELSFGYRF